MSLRHWTDEQLAKAVATSTSFSETGAKLGLTTFGSNSRTIKKRIAFLQLDTSHFLTVSERSKRNSLLQAKRPQKEILCINDIHRKHIKKYIIKNDLIPYKCSECGITEWTGKILSLHLDHINGINNDNRLENLRFLCPNCHSLTDTYCGKKLKGKKFVSYTCVDCEAPITNEAKRCRHCNDKLRNTKIYWPSTSFLIQRKKEIGCTHLAKELGVTDSAINKRIKNHPDFMAPEVGFEPT